MTTLLRDPRLGLLWLAVRLWVGWELLLAGWARTVGADRSEWWGSTRGIDRILESASAPGSPSAHWYGALAEHVFAPLDDVLAVAVPLVELLAGVCLAIGFLTPLAATVAALVALNAMLAGVLADGMAPLVLTLSLLLLAAGPAASVYGVDRFTSRRPLPARADARR